MENQESINIKSEEVQEILGTPPSWLVQWGTSIAFVTFLAIGWATYFLQYNETVTRAIVVSSTDPPQTIRAEERRQISRIYVENEQSVEAGQLLIDFASRANTADVFTLETALLMVDPQNDSSLVAMRLPTDLILGELEDDFFDFINTQELVRLEQSGKSQKQNVRFLENEIDQARSGIRNERKKKANLIEQMRLVERRYQRDQNLLKQNLITPLQVEKTKEELLSLERMLKTIEWNIKNNEFIVSSRREEINGVERGSEETMMSAKLKLRESFGRLVRNLENWKNDFVITSPYNGIVLIAENIGAQQYVFGSSELMRIIPTDKKETKGKMELSVKGSGRVVVGQKVLVKLESYPFPDFGAVEGEVSRIGVSIEDKVPVEVSFPNGFVTTNGRKIESTKTLKGEASIIVEEKRFIQRIFEEARSIIWSGGTPEKQEASN